MREVTVTRNEVEGRTVTETDVLVRVVFTVATVLVMEVRIVDVTVSMRVVVVAPCPNTFDGTTKAAIEKATSRMEKSLWFKPVASA